uniref:ABC transporter G family member 11 n=1 Tax=Aegilops tauschii TaxID=37682 RepID=R7VZ46_AEGTA
MVSWRGWSTWPSSPIFFPRCLSDSEPPASGVVDNVEPGTTEVFLTWKDLSVTAMNGRKGRAVILDKLSGYARPGEVLALMGPSGCGKTTLLDTLAGRLGPNMKESGEIMINGCRQKIASRTSAYVTQEDVLMVTLTVAEAVHYSAELQLPDSLTPAEKRSWADDVIKQMGLAAVAGTRIGGPVSKGISGGQRKRVSICIELLASPALIFLDEPTSGLDSAASYHVMSRIVGIAKRNGTTVVAAIHPPSTEVFELFHGLCLLANGKTVYFGPASKAMEGISGGQRKRVSICIELLASPALIFLDEPTSGRDSAASYHVMSRIVGIAKRNGTTVVAAIHQPSTEVFELFHGLCLLANGKTVYFGPASKAMELLQQFHNVDKNAQTLTPICTFNLGKAPPNQFPEQILYTSRSRQLKATWMVNQRRAANEHEIKRCNSHLGNLYFFDANGFPCPLRMNPSGHFLRMINIDFEGEYVVQQRQATFLTKLVVLTKRSMINMHRDIGYYWLRFGIYMALFLTIGKIFFNVGHNYSSIQIFEKERRSGH